MAINKNSVSIINKAIVAVVVAIAVLLILSLLWGWIEANKSLDETREYWENHPAISDDFSEFADYCRRYSGDCEIVEARVSGQYALLAFNGIDDMKEAYDMYLMIRQYIDDNPDCVFCDNCQLKITMQGDGFYAELQADSPFEIIDEIKTFSYSIPNELPSESYDNVQRLTVYACEGMSEERVEILENMFPNTEITFE